MSATKSLRDTAHKLFFLGIIGNLSGTNLTLIKGVVFISSTPLGRQLISSTSTFCRHPLRRQVHFADNSFRRKIHFVDTCFVDRYILSTFVSSTGTFCRHLFRRQVHFEDNCFVDRYILSILVSSTVILWTSSFRRHYFNRQINFVNLAINYLTN